MESDLPPMSAVIYRCVKKFPPRRTRAAGPAQKKSAGSFIAGNSISNHRVNVDFSSLPADMLQYLKSNHTKFRFHYNDYSFIIGYGYNLVFAQKFVFNVTATPSIGFKHSLADSSDGKHNKFTLNVLGRMGLVYNVSDFFFGLTGKIDGHWFRGSHYNFFHSVETVSLSTGVRF